MKPPVIDEVKVVIKGAEWQNLRWRILPFSEEVILKEWMVFSAAAGYGSNLSDYSKVSVDVPVLILGESGTGKELTTGLF